MNASLLLLKVYEERNCYHLEDDNYEDDLNQLKYHNAGKQVL